MKKSAVKYTKNILLKICILNITILIIIFIFNNVYNGYKTNDNKIENKIETRLPDITFQEKNSNIKIIPNDNILGITPETLPIENKKVVYLTFDDGPSSIVTPKILDILKDYNIKATFFVLGKCVDNNSKIFRRIIDEGHGIGNHSYSHEYKHIYSSVDNLVNEINKANKSIDVAAGIPMNIKAFRFPGGSFDKKKKFKDAVKNLGMIYYDWNCLNGDAEAQNPPKQYLIDRFIETSNDQEKLIILMHDTNAKINTIDALSEIINYLKERNYTFDILK